MLSIFAAQAIPESNGLDATTIAAWWGAILATVVFGWDICKYLMERPDLKVTIEPNFSSQAANEPPGNQYMKVKIRNRGRKLTTIESVTLIHYRRKPYRWRDGKEVERFPILENKLPVTIAPGGMWSEFTEQKFELKLISNEYLQCVVAHSESDIPVTCHALLMGTD